MTESAVAAPPVDFSQRLVEFAFYLKDAGIPVPISAVVDAERLTEMGYFTEPKLFFSGLRSVFCHQPKHWRAFDLLFEEYWFGESVDSDVLTDQEQQGRPEQKVVRGGAKLVGFGGTSSDDMGDLLGAGDFKALSLADFRFMFNPAEKQRIEKMVESLARKIRRRQQRKYVDSRKPGPVNLRRSIRESIPQQGLLTKLYYKKRQKQLPKFVLLIDISQSVDVYAKLFLRYTRCLMSLFESAETFAFNIRLLPLGKGHAGLSEETFEAVLNGEAKGWLGGTRIADSLATFNRDFLRSSVSNKTTVLIFSDGYDTATPDKLLPELAIIKRRAKKIIWVNPLLGRGDKNRPNANMDPLMPLIDDYQSAHNLESLAELEKVLLRQ